MRKTALLLSCMLLSATPLSLAAADAGVILEIRNALMCTCPDCTMVLFDCNCSTADNMVATIRGMLGTGMSRTDVIEAYVARYGEVILSAPTREGFNLVAWVFPFVMLGAGSVLVVAVLRLWTSKSRAGDDQQPRPKPMDGALLTKVAQEMDELGI